MSIRQLRTLVAVAEARTFTAAAERVHISHAAVSQQMQALEAELGVTLFDRSTRTPELTPTGRQIVAKARSLIADYDNLVPSVQDDGDLRGVLTMGVMRTTLTGLTPRAVAALKARFPALGLHIRPGLTTALLASIARGQLDAAVVSKPAHMPHGIAFRALTDEPMQLIAAHDEPEDDPIKLLETRPYIRFDRGAVVGALIDNWILTRRIRVTETMELDSPEAITSMVEANLGVSIVPDLAVKAQEATQIKSLPLGRDAPRRTLGLAHQADHPRMRALDALFDAFAGVIPARTDGPDTA